MPWEFKIFQNVLYSVFGRFGPNVYNPQQLQNHITRGS